MFKEKTKLTEAILAVTGLVILTGIVASGNAGQKVEAEKKSQRATQDKLTKEKENCGPKEIDQLFVGCNNFF